LNLGRYEVIRELGKGAMGVVYLAKDPVIGRLVALKTIRSTGSNDDAEIAEFRERFVREAQAAGILSHPSIVTVHDIGQDAETGTSFIAMEYVEGKNLKDLLNQGRRLTHAEVAIMIAQIAEALDYAHSKGIVHRDIKPANIIQLSEERAKITDFGIAKIASGAANLTSTGQFLGTPNYMSPEQIRGAKIDGRADLFSLGVVLYEMLVQRKPFSGDSLTSISYKIVHESFVPLREVDPSIPAVYDEIVQRCLETDPERRYQRGNDLARHLSAAARGEALPRLEEKYREDETVMTTGAGKESAAGAPYAGSSEATVASVGAGVSTPMPTAGPDEMTMTDPGLRKAAPKAPTALKKRIPAIAFFGIVALLVAIVGVAAFMISRQRVTVPEVDTQRETDMTAQGKLLREGNELLAQGNVEGAWQKFAQLKAINPDSPAVDQMIRSLESIRVARMSQQQRSSSAQAKLEEGLQAYDRQDYEAAINAFQEAFNLDPTNQSAINYLRMSREQLELQGGSSAADGGVQQTASGTTRPQQTTRPQTVTTPPAQTQQGSSTQAAAQGETGNPASPATLLTQCESTFTDGSIIVRVNGNVIVNETLWEERKVAGFIKRKQPKSVSVYSQLDPGVAEIQVEVSIPSLGLRGSKSVRANLTGGTLHRLVISIDQPSKSFNVDVS